MLKRSFKLIVIIMLWCGLTAAFAESISPASQNKTKVVSERIALLKNRVIQAEHEFANLQHQQGAPLSKFTADQVNKQWLAWTRLDVAAAKSNLNSVTLELSEIQQTIGLLEKDTQDLENQINVYHIFGTKMARNGIPNIASLNAQLIEQRSLLSLEKTDQAYLKKLETIAEKTLQLYIERQARVENILKSHTLLQLKEQQARSEIDYQKQQTVWLGRLNKLYTELGQLELKSKNKSEYIRVKNAIFYANENVNYLYLQMLVARGEEQIQQLKISISRSNSIILLNKVGEQTQLLGKQFSRINDLLLERITILNKRNSYITQYTVHDTTLSSQLAELKNQYLNSINYVSHLNTELGSFRATLDQALQQELSARQGLVGFGARAWLDLGGELLIVPALTFHIVMNLTELTAKSLYTAQSSWWLLLSLFEIAWFVIFYYTHRLLTRIMSTLPDHELGHISLKWLSIKILRRVWVDVAVLGNIYWFFALCRIPTANFNFIINTGLVWLFFKVLILIARLCLVETVHDRSGHDVRLFYRLKWTFLLGGIVTALTLYLHQLPMIYEVKDLFYRLFLLFLAVVSCFIIRSWNVLPELILLHVDKQRAYFRGVVRLLGLLIPVIILINSAIGLFGFLNFVLTVSWYESVFMLVMIGYLVLRGLLDELMQRISYVLIRHVANGWLWSEAFLKPIDKIFKVILFLASWVFLFFIYGWDRQSPMVERIGRLLKYPMVELLNAVITPISILELFVMLSLLYWVARWTREFVFRFLLSNTSDLGVRNSIAILSQYSMIVIVILIGLRVLGIDFKALTVVAGAFAFGIGLGLRDLANNFVCGFLLLLERPLRVGDTVSIGGYEGEVTHIGGRAVTVRTWDHMDVLVPNAEIFSKSFTNWTAKDTIVRTVITIKLNRQDSPQDVQQLIHQAIAGHRSVLSDPPPEVFLKELADELTEFEVRYYINLRQVKSRISVRSEVLMLIWAAFERSGIKPPHPQHEIHIKTGIESFLNPVS